VHIGLQGKTGLLIFLVDLSTKEIENIVCPVLYLIIIGL